MYLSGTLKLSDPEARGSNYSEVYIKYNTKKYAQLNADTERTPRTNIPSEKKRESQKKTNHPP